MYRIMNLLQSKTFKTIGICVLSLLIVFGFCYRFYVVYKESKQAVFNMDRDYLVNGKPVETMIIQKMSGVLYEPVTIKNNHIYVSSARLSMFQAGQKIGNCKIISVSKELDLDTGMHVIKTKGCDDGLQYVEKKAIGFFVPVSAVSTNTLYVVDGNMAKQRIVNIADRDYHNVLITSGLQDGEEVILSSVVDNEKVKIIK